MQSLLVRFKHRLKAKSNLKSTSKREISPSWSSREGHYENFNHSISHYPVFSPVQLPLKSSVFSSDLFTDQKQIKNLNPQKFSTMIQLLFTLLAAEVAFVFVLLFKTPLRKLAIMGLDRLKRGRGPVMVKTVAGTVVLVLASSIYSMTRIRSRSEEGGAGLTPTDQVLMSRHLLEASLMGYTLLLALIIDRLHHYIRELRGLRKSMEAVMKQNRTLEESKSGGSDDIKAKEKEIASLNEQIKILKSESEERLKEAKTAEANALALKKQSEGFLLEYDRLLEDNQNLRSQLQSIDVRLSHSDSKKNT